MTVLFNVYFNSHCIVNETDTISTVIKLIIINRCNGGSSSPNLNGDSKKDGQTDPNHKLMSTLLVGELIIIIKTRENEEK